MSAILPKLTPDETGTYNKLYKSFSQKSSHAGYSAGAATFLFISALIIITCSSLCLMLPGVNVIRDVILPGTLPGGLALLFSIPLITLTIFLQNRKEKAQKLIVNDTLRLVDHYKVIDLKKDKKVDLKVDFLFNNFLTKGSRGFKKRKLMGIVKKKIEEQHPKDTTGKREENAEGLLKAIDEAIEKSLKT